MTARSGTERAARRRFGRAGRALLVAIVIVVAARPAPIASGPRPPVVGAGTVADRTAAPVPHVDERFATLPFVDALGRPGTWVLSATAKPLQMVAEREVVDLYGVDELGRALEVWNATPGSTFAVHLAGIADEGVDDKRRDGVNRVFLDRRSCGERFLARAHLYPAEVQERDGRSVAWVTEVDIGVCERLSPDLLAAVVRHELAHVAGVGHLCDPDEDCWTPQMGHGNRCRIMATAAYPCQELTDADEEALAHLHPRLPRISGTDVVATAASASGTLFPRAGTQSRIVLTAAGAPTELSAAAAVLAGVAGAPHLVTDGDCTDGRDATELNRVAAVDATVVLIGAVPGACEDDLRLGWELDVERLPDLAAVHRALAQDAGDPSRLVVTPPPDDAPTVPTVALAVPVAVGLGAPLVTSAPEDLHAVVADAVAAHPSIRGVVVLDTAGAFRGADVARLEATAGVRVRHLAATDGVDLALRVARMRDVFPAGEVRTVLLAADRPGDAVAAATVAATTGATLLPVFAGAASPDVRIAGFLDERASGGYVVGGAAGIDTALQVRLSRAVDGRR